MLFPAVRSNEEPFFMGFLSREVMNGSAQGGHLQRIHTYANSRRNDLVHAAKVGAT